MSIEYTCFMVAFWKGFVLKGRKNECCLIATTIMRWHIVLAAGENMNGLHDGLSL